MLNPGRRRILSPPLLRQPPRNRCVQNRLPEPLQNLRRPIQPLAAGIEPTNQAIKFVSKATLFSSWRNWNLGTFELTLRDVPETDSSLCLPDKLI